MKSEKQIPLPKPYNKIDNIPTKRHHLISEEVREPDIEPSKSLAKEFRPGEFGPDIWSFLKC